MGNSRRLVEDRSGFCQAGNCHLCSWGEGYETPSAIVTCVCRCHQQPAVNGHEPQRTTTRVLVPKGPSAARVLVPKK